ncbi:hypothetical protein [Holospora curviuscula]|uniref:Uncharacterized protein n=1 Tax=Holospora curviuscula TaxID=1082868 RepID=A0A2S5R9E1_9PROT|nr:hypothetical protein [Holospora curviuscula]PPE03934.1 hypothetical protein HCUR_00715 [Holospora curviuscula]
MKKYIYTALNAHAFQSSHKPNHYRENENTWLQGYYDTIDPALKKLFEDEK